MTALPQPGLDWPPYHSEEFPGFGSAVFNKYGVNCLTFTDKPGAVFTTRADAETYAAAWNGAIK